MTDKLCTTCKKSFPATSDFFNKCAIHRDGLQYSCRECTQQYYHINKKRISIQLKEYRSKNKQIIAKRKRAYHVKNRPRKREANKRYRLKNKDIIIKSSKKYRLKNRQKIQSANKEYNNRKASYLYTKKLLLYDNIRIHPTLNNVGQIQCAYCGRWTVPMNKEIGQRLLVINGINSGEGRIYCSTECKTACPTYNQEYYYKGSKMASSREVDPYIRQLCFKRDNYACQKCNKIDIELHCHHIDGAAKEPLLANDIDNVITFCKECHKIVHSKDGCHYSDYQRPVCK